MAADLIDIAKRRGIFWQSAQLHGSIAGFSDYGHIGKRIKNKLEQCWRTFFLGLDDHFHEIETSLIMPEAVFRASGHLRSFVDPVVKCGKCGSTERADHLLEAHLKEKFEGLSPAELLGLIKKHKLVCHRCKGELQEVGELNMMFPLHVGTGTDVKKAYLTPETAQGSYLNFRSEYEALRKQLPFGLAIIGKAFRNEISPRQGLIRMREFTQAELQIFFDPAAIDAHPKFTGIENEKIRTFSVKNRKTNKTEPVTCSELVKTFGLPRFYVYHMAKMQEFYLDVLRLPPDKFRFKQLSDEEKAFYNQYHWDIEIDIPGLGFIECGGLHYRTDHDLAGHQKISGQNLEVTADGRRFVPHVLEISCGVDRTLYALLSLALHEEKDRTYLSLQPPLAPYHAVVLPLVKKDGLPEKARQVYELLKKAGIEAKYDEEYVGKAYYRQDEIGTLFCITYDYDSLKDKAVTIRFRDTKQQRRVAIAALAETLQRLIKGTLPFEKAGKAVK